MKKARRRSSDRPASTPRRKPTSESRRRSSPTRGRTPSGLAPEPRKEESPTAVAAEALRKGIVPGTRARPAIPHEDELIRVGDPDDDSLQNEYSGEDTPGGSTPTPDQSNIDEIGRVYGLSEEDSGALQAAGEILSRRDRRRPELKAPSKPRS
jgi:hypothetical protein